MIKDFITYILNIFNSTNPNLYYLRLLLILTVMIVAILLTNHIRKDTKYNVEGFSQKEQSNQVDGDHDKLSTLLVAFNSIELPSITDINGSIETIGVSKTVTITV